MGSPDSTTAARATPPTVPRAIVEEANRWPTVIGAIAIAFASLSLVTTVGSVVLTPFFSQATGTAMKPLGWVVSGIGFAVTLIHLVGGIQVTRRRRSGPGILLAWAWLNSVFVIATTLLGMGQMLSTAPPPTQAPTPLPSWYIPVVMIFSVLLSLAWPIFLLIFLTRSDRKAQWKSWR